MSNVKGLGNPSIFWSVIPVFNVEQHCPKTDCFFGFLILLMRYLTALPELMQVTTECEEKYVLHDEWFVGICNICRLWLMGCRVQVQLGSGLKRSGSIFLLARLDSFNDLHLPPWDFFDYFSFFFWRITKHACLLCTGIKSGACRYPAVEHIHLETDTSSSIPQSDCHPDGLFPRLALAPGCVPWSHLVIVETRGLWTRCFRYLSIIELG